MRAGEIVDVELEPDRVLLSCLVIKPCVAVEFRRSVLGMVIRKLTAKERRIEGGREVM